MGGRDRRRDRHLRRPRDGRRFLAQRLDGLLDEPRPGAPRTIGDADVERVIADYDEVRVLAADAADRFGRIGGLVNNAGMLNVLPVSRVLFDQIPEEEWDLVFDENIKSVWHCCRAFVPYMRDGQGGSIVNIASSTVFRSLTTRAHYVASKAAVIGFSRVLSKELGGDWIRVNVVAPGSTLSEENPDPDVVRMREEPVRGRALQRVQVPDDVVGTVLFLLSDDSEFVTGQTLIVEGGGIVR